MGRASSLKIDSLIEQGRIFVMNFWKMQMFLSKWLSGIFSRMLVYESRESGLEVIPGMHIWAQLGVYGGGPRPPTSLRELISLRGILTYLREFV